MKIYSLAQLDVFTNKITPLGEIVLPEVQVNSTLIFGDKGFMVMELRAVTEKSLEDLLALGAHVPNGTQFHNHLLVASVRDLVNQKMGIDIDETPSSIVSDDTEIQESVKPSMKVYRD